MCALLCCFNGQRKVDLMVARDQRQRRWSLDNTSSSQFALRSCLCHPLFTLAGSHFQDTMQAAARQVDDKECYSSYTTNGGGGAAINGRRKNPPGPSSRGPKPMPSKWDDAQKWLVGSAAAANAAKPRNSNADDRRLLSSSCSQNGRISCSSMDGALEYNMVVAPPTPPQLGEDDGETKNMDEVVRASVCLRDMGTEMTPIASKEPSRAATPLRASTPVDARSPVSSRSSTPARAKPWQQQDLPLAATVVRTPEPLHGGEAESHVPSRNSLESRAAAWDEAERAKFTARYKREEVKIQAWENHEKRKAEMEMKKIEMKAEQMKARAQERLANKLAAARRVAEEKRASAEAMLNEGAARTSEKADYIRRTGHLPSSFFSFSFRIPSLCG